MDFAACAGMDPELFFPAKGGSPNDAIMTCFTCGVRAECDDFRKRTGSTHGVWAGRLSKRSDGGEAEDDVAD